MEDRCVCCGEIIPEGRQVCIRCEIMAETEEDLINLKVAEELLREYANESKICRDISIRNTLLQHLQEKM